MDAPFVLSTVIRKIVGDTVTPVGAYLRLREKFPGTCLLESADYQPNENCFTYVCINPIAEFKVANGTVHQRLPGEESRTEPTGTGRNVLDLLSAFHRRFETVAVEKHPFVINGLFGYVSYEAIEFFEDLRLRREPGNGRRIPAIWYQAFEFLLAINHYKNEMYLVQNRAADGTPFSNVTLEEIEHLASFGSYGRSRFERAGEESSNFTDEGHLAMIERCKQHVYRGDVFQIVPSRRFDQPFRGDDFNVYRALRIINPSPYLFYFDFGGFRIFGSSPEAELIVKDGTATIFPIAGTCPRTGDESRDEVLVERLVADPKENAEHVMLVDLARNDLSKHCDHVRVERYKEIHRYSHVIHLVSQVSGRMKPGVGAVELLADTFPAGTLSGAPKYRALQLIDEYEGAERSFYSGAIGFLGFDGSCNHAIIIRSFLSKNNVLYRQAGGGVVSESIPENEVQEVRNKLEALRRAIEMAETIGS